MWVWNEFFHQLISSRQDIEIEVEQLNSGKDCSTFEINEEMLLLFNNNMYVREAIPQELNRIVLRYEPTDESDITENEDDY